MNDKKIEMYKLFYSNLSERFVSDWRNSASEYNSNSLFIKAKVTPVNTICFKENCSKTVPFAKDCQIGPSYRKIECVWLTYTNLVIKAATYPLVYAALLHTQVCQSCLLGRILKNGKLKNGVEHS